MRLSLPSLPAGLEGLRRQLELGDLIILIFIAAFIRQYLWPLGHNTLAWLLTALLAALAWLWHLRTKGERARPPAVFYLIVALPLLFFYALRAALPELGWDVMDYRIINAERALSGWPMRPGDFFPTRFPFNPAPDMVMGIGRYLFGYRLGTIINLAALVWTGLILERLLHPFIERDGLRCLGVLLLVMTEQLLFEINNYMVDMLALPLLLEATRLALSAPGDVRQQRRTFARIGLYLGAALAFKLTNLAFALPIALVCAYRLARQEWSFDLRAASYGIIAVALPLLPYSLYIYWQTGNPVFPLYNWIFQSPYWPVIDPRTDRWGPIVDDPRFKNMKLWEILLWPLLLPFRVENTAGDLGPHWGRISVAFLAALAGLLWPGADRRVRALSFITLSGAILWSAASGMLRYAMFVEVVGGAIAVYLIFALLGKAKETRALSVEEEPGWRTLKSTAAALLLLAMVAQSASSCVYAFRFEWGGRSNFFHDPRSHLHEARFFLRDRTPLQFLSEEERALVRETGVWVESGPMTSGLTVMLSRNTPHWTIYMTEFFETETARQRFTHTVEQARGQRIRSFCLADDLQLALRHIRRAGFGLAQIQPLILPYYSDRRRYHTGYLLELLPPGQAAARQFDITAASAPLPQGAFKATLSWAQPPPARLRAGQRLVIRVLLKNGSDTVWPVLGQAGGNYRIMAGNHWLDTAGRVLINDDARSFLPYDLAPGDEIELPLTIHAPLAPGRYILEVDMLQEGVSWFGHKGSTTLRLDVLVE